MRGTIQYDEAIGNDEFCRRSLFIVQQQIAGHIDRMIAVALPENVLNSNRPVTMQFGLTHRFSIGFGVINFVWDGDGIHGINISCDWRMPAV